LVGKGGKSYSAVGVEGGESCSCAGLQRYQESIKQIKQMTLEVVATMQSGEAAPMEAREAQRRGARRQTDG
jgi:hypothetical protein